MEILIPVGYGVVKVAKVVGLILFFMGATTVLSVPVISHLEKKVTKKVSTNTVRNK